MTLQEELQINIVMSNYVQRSGSYSSNYDYIFLDNLAESSYSNLFRDDLKNLKIKTKDKTECKILFAQTQPLMSMSIHHIASKTLTVDFIDDIFA